MRTRSLTLCSLGIALVATLSSTTALAGSNLHLRGDFHNARQRFEKDGIGHVAFIGGSITEMEGYRPIVAKWLAERFPKTKFTFTNAGISSTCSTTGAFRLGRDVLDVDEKLGPPDLLFVEFAVNDDQDAGHPRREAIRGLEGLLRRTRRSNPRMDVVVTYFVNPGMLALLRDGKTPVSIAAHETVAEHYGVSSVHLAQEVADRIDAGTLTWKDYGGTHPKRPGNQLAADLVTELLATSWKQPVPSATTARKLPEPLDDHAYFEGHLLDPAAAEPTAGWSVGKPDWSKIRGQLRSRFAKDELLHSSPEGAEPVKLSFAGRGVGAYVLAGPDAGIAEVRIDGGEWKTVDLYHRFSRGLHYPRTVMFFADLEPGRHELELRPAKMRNPNSRGHAIRILNWAVNGPAAPAAR